MPTATGEKKLDMVIDGFIKEIVYTYLDPIYLFLSLCVRENNVHINENYVLDGSYHNAMLISMNPLYQNHVLHNPPLIDGVNVAKRSPRFGAARC